MHGSGGGHRILQNNVNSRHPVMRGVRGNNPCTAERLVAQTVLFPESPPPARICQLPQTAVAESFRRNGPRSQNRPVVIVVGFGFGQIVPRKTFAVAAMLWYDVVRSAGRPSSGLELVADVRDPRTNGWTEAAVSSFQVVHPSVAARSSRSFVVKG